MELIDLYDHGARLYDHELGRWHAIDPRTEDYYDLSPYNYVANNPVIYVDPNGEFIGTIIGAVIGGVSAAIKSNGDWQEIKAGIISGAVAGAIVDGVVALTIASGGTATPGLLAAAGAIGSASGEKVYQMLTGRDDPAAVAKAGLFGMAGGIAAGMMPALSRALTPSGKSLKLTIGEPTQVIDDIASGGAQSIKSVGAAARGFSKTINFGKIKVPAETFHRQIKPDILSRAGDFSKAVGRNPDIKIVSGKIRLTGTGSFKGKTFNTGLDAADFFEGY